MRQLKINGNYVKDPFFEIDVEGIKTLETGKPIDKRAIIHRGSGQVISVVNPDWNIIENRKLINDFEKTLENDNIAFVRTSAGVSYNLSKFWCNYRFPDVSIKLSKPYTTNLGSYVDRIQLSLDVWGGYAPGVSTGFMTGGWREICSNGLMRVEKMFGQTWNHNRIKQSDLLNTFHNQVITAQNLFQNQMVSGWEQLSEQKYNKPLAVKVMRSLFQELKDTPTYRDKLYWLFIQRQKEDQLKTMWAFYNMLTWFFTHSMEARSRQRAMRLTASVGNQLMEKIAA